MITVRRIYVFLMSAISLHGVAWAIISLIRNTFAPNLNPPKEAIAFQIAAIIVGLPFFLGHWLWAQRLAKRDEDERHSFLRTFYLYGMMVGFLGPLVANSFGLIATLLAILFGEDRQHFIYTDLTPGQTLIYHLAATIVLAALWWYHQNVLKADSQQTSPSSYTPLLRRLYIIGFSSAGIIMAALGVFGLLRWLLLALLTTNPLLIPNNLSPAGDIARILVSLPFWLLVMADLRQKSPARWVRVFKVLVAGEVELVLAGLGELFQRIYILLASATGMVLATVGFIHLLRWILLQFGTDVIQDPNLVGLATEVARLSVGVPIWLFFWHWAQQIFERHDETKPLSILRQLYLHTTIFVAMLTAVTNIAFVLSGLFRRLLNLPSMGDIRTPLPIIVGAGFLWVYHAYVLRSDMAPGEAPDHRSWVRHLYFYLLAGIGLAAVLTGFSGLLSVLIRMLDSSNIINLKEQIPWFISALIVGLPLWLLPWRAIQLAVTADHQSLIRKIYLYLYLSIASITLLSGAIYIVSQLVGLLIGARDSSYLLSDLGQAIAFSLVGGVLGYYHGSILRHERNLAQENEDEKLASLTIVVVDGNEGQLGQALQKALKQALPQMKIRPFPLTDIAAEAMLTDEIIAESEAEKESPTAVLASADLIIGPWTIAVADEVGAEVATAVAESPAHKLLLPTPATGWTWAGVPSWDSGRYVAQAVTAVHDLALGTDVKPARRLGCLQIGGMIVGGIILLWIVGSIIYEIYWRLF
jgi:Domain of unknown function (DUF5671)/Domain of unknown function (DUF3842)